MGQEAGSGARRAPRARFAAAARRGGRVPTVPAASAQVPPLWPAREARATAQRCRSRRPRSYRAS